MRMWFVTAFWEVEAISVDNKMNSLALNDLKRAGNLFPTERQARQALHIIKTEIGRNAETLYGICD